MASSRSSSSAWLVAGLALAGLGLASTWHGLRVTPELLRHIESKQARLVKLDDLRAELGNAEQGFAAFAAVEQQLLSALPVVFEKAAPGLTPEFAEFDPKPASQGTTLRTVNVNVGPMELSGLNPLLETLESYEPPWRIVECLVRATPSQSGWGTVTLSLEGLEKL